MPRPWNNGLRMVFPERLWAKVELARPDGWWPFTGGSRSGFGYGGIRDVGGPGVLAHKACRSQFERGALANRAA